MTEKQFQHFENLRAAVAPEVSIIHIASVNQNNEITDSMYFADYAHAFRFLLQLAVVGVDPDKTITTWSTTRIIIVIPTEQIVNHFLQVVDRDEWCEEVAECLCDSLNADSVVPEQVGVPIMIYASAHRVTGIETNYGDTILPLIRDHKRVSEELTEEVAADQKKRVDQLSNQLNDLATRVMDGDFDKKAFQA